MRELWNRILRGLGIHRERVYIPVVSRDGDPAWELAENERSNDAARGRWASIEFDALGDPFADFEYPGEADHA